MTQKAKGPAEVAPSTPSQVQTPDKGHKNMQSNIMELSAGATEFPEQRIRRLAKEISATLNDVDDYQVIIIYPSAAADYPVQVCLDGEFSELLEAVVRLRKERREAIAHQAGRAGR